MRKPQRGEGVELAGNAGKLGELSFLFPVKACKSTARFVGHTRPWEGRWRSASAESLVTGCIPSGMLRLDSKVEVTLCDHLSPQARVSICTSN